MRKVIERTWDTDGETTQPPSNEWVKVLENPKKVVYERPNTLEEEAKEQAEQAQYLAMLEDEKKIQELKQRLIKLNEDIIQDYIGEIVPDIETRKAEFISKHNELRVLLGKEERATKS